MCLTGTGMHRTLLLFLWLAPSIVEIGILAGLLSRKLWQQFPIFFSYLLFEVGRTALLFSLEHSYVKYFYCYWITECLGCMAAFWVVRELFSVTFSRHLGLQKLGDIIFRGSALLLAGLAAIVALTSPGSDINRLVAGIVTMKQAVTIFQVGLLASLFLAAYALGIPWRHYTIGIALGMGVYSLVELALIVMRSHFGQAYNGLFSWGVLTANNLMVAIWGWYILVSRPVPLPAVPAPETRGRLQEWNAALLELLK